MVVRWYTWYVVQMVHKENRKKGGEREIIISILIINYINYNLYNL